MAIQTHAGQVTLALAALTMTAGSVTEAADTLQSQRRTPVAAPTGGVAGPAPTCGNAACVYKNPDQDGTSENAIGVGGDQMVWFYPFEATPGCSVIECVQVVIGSIPGAEGSPIKIFIYDDPNDDRLPDDAVLLAPPTEGITANEDTDIFNEYTLDNPISVEGVFFVCASVETGVADTFPAAQDDDEPIGLENWVAFGIANEDDPLQSASSLDVIEAFGAGLAGDWMLRAVGAGDPLPCPGDTNDDHDVDVNDLNNVILDWGTDGSGNNGDITGPLPGSGPDGIVNVNDLNAIIVGWGLCDVINDDCAGRVRVFNGTTDFHTVGATLDVSAPPFRCGVAANDVWFNYRATGDGTLTVDTCGSQFDTVLKLYDTWGCPPLELDNLVCNDDATDKASSCNGTLQSSVTIEVVAGQEFKIRVGGVVGDAEGWGLLNVTFDADPIPVPDNDECADAIALTSGVAVPGTTIGATAEGAQVFPCGLPVQAPGVWYSWTGTGNRVLLRTDCNELVTTYDSTIHVYCPNPDCSSLLCIGGDDDGCGMLGDGVPSEFVFCSAVGQEYLILVSGSGGAIGDFEVLLSESSACPTPTPCREPLANDDCDNAEVILAGTHPFSTSEATTDGPDTGGAAECSDFGETQTWNDIWYEYEATIDGLFIVNTCEQFMGSANYDSDLVIYGPYADPGDIDCNDLLANIYACNDDSTDYPCGTGDFHSVIETTAFAGEHFLIRVGGWGEGDFGDGVLHVLSAPADDDFCAFATDVGVPSELGTEVVVDTTAATVDNISPYLNENCSTAANGPGRWVRCVGNGNDYTVEICAQVAFTFDTRLNVFCGPCTVLECVAEANDNAACDPFNETIDWCTFDGGEYYVLVSGIGAGMTGVVDMTITDNGSPCLVAPCAPLPGSDICADAIDVTANINGAPVLGDNTDSTPFQNDGGTGDPEIPLGSPSCHWDTTPTDVHNTEWWKFVAPANGAVTVTVCDTELDLPTTDFNDSIIGLYSGSCGTLLEVACGEDNCNETEPGANDGGPPYYSFFNATGLTPGETYYLMIGNPGSWGGVDQGEYQIILTSP